MTAALPNTSRPAFFPGQILAAADLAAQTNAETGLRALHSRALHGWGIALGLAVTAVRGDVAVAVGAGYALDADGHDLVLEKPSSLAVPPVSQGPDGGPVTFCLTLRWTTDEEAVVVDRGGACATSGAVQRRGDPTLAWLPPPALRVGLDLVLATVSVRDCVLTAAPDASGRRLLRPPPTPYVCAGRTDAAVLGWARRYSAGTVWAIATDVDTSEAGFGEVPTYLPRIVGGRLLDAAMTPTGEPALVDGTPYVESAETGRFRLVVPLTAAWGAESIPLNPQSLLASESFPDLVANTLGWAVEWIGVQS